jgi:hypothetical protein
MEISGDVNYIPTLLNKLEYRTHPFIRDEIILALAGLLGFYDWFYAHYVVFLEKGYDGASLLSDQLDKYARRKKTGPVEDFGGIIEALLGKPDLFRKEAAKDLEKYPVIIKGKNIAPLFAAALENPSILRLERFRYLTASMIVYFSTR